MNNYRRISNKVVTILLVMLASGVALYLIMPILFSTVTNPIIPIKTIERPIDNKIVSAKQIEKLLNEEMINIEEFSNLDLVIGSIEMELNNGQRGGIYVKYIEAGKDGGESKVIIARLSTRTGILHSIQDMGKDGKNYPGGVLKLSDWLIDSTDAVEISIDNFSNSIDFKYDEIIVRSRSYILENVEAWDVWLVDKNDNIRYEVRINPYSGEVINDRVISY